MEDVYNSLPMVKFSNFIGTMLAAIVDFFSGLAPAYIFLLIFIMLLSLIAYLFFAIRRMIENAYRT
jgi:hypothetical protein